MPGEGHRERPAGPVSVFIDFGAEYGVPVSTYAGAADFGGVWNKVPSSGLSALLDTDGADPSVGFAFTGAFSDGAVGSGATGDAELLLRDNFYASSGTSWGFTISGLPNGLYDIIYYAPAHLSISTGTFSIEGTGVASLSGDSSALGEGASWAKLQDVSITDGTLDVLSTTNSGLRGLAGIQVIAVPEPSVSGLGLIAGLILLARRRR